MPESTLLGVQMLLTDVTVYLVVYMQTVERVVSSPRERLCADHWLSIAVNRLG